MTPQQASALTDDEINIALAKLTGWTQSAKGWWSHPILPDRGGAMFGPPDFCTDLNAVHEVEKTMSKSKRAHYQVRLAVIVGDHYHEYNDHWSDSPVFATARQRCEALLVTMGVKE